jgi:hypothetical protein
MWAMRRVAESRVRESSEGGGRIGPDLDLAPPPLFIAPPPLRGEQKRLPPPAAVPRRHVAPRSSLASRFDASPPRPLRAACVCRQRGARSRRARGARRQETATHAPIGDFSLPFHSSPPRFSAVFCPAPPCRFASSRGKRKPEFFFGVLSTKKKAT